MNINAIGRLGRDAENVNLKNGKTALRYSLAVDEYNYETKQNDTMWLNVLDTTENSQKLRQFLTKGRLINLVGSMKVPQIVDTQKGKSVSLDVFAFNWNFVSGGKTDATAAPNPSATATVAPQISTPKVDAAPTPKPTTGAFVPPTIPQSAPSAATTNSADDLPF